MKVEDKKLAQDLIGALQWLRKELIDTVEEGKRHTDDWWCGFSSCAKSLDGILAGKLEELGITSLEDVVITESPWKKPSEELPKIYKQDPSITYGKISDPVLVRINIGLAGEQYRSAYYTSMAYHDELNYAWRIDGCTGNWDSKVISWMHIPTE